MYCDMTKYWKFHQIHAVCYTINNHNFYHLSTLKVFALLTKPPPTCTTLGPALCHPSRNQLGLLHLHHLQVEREQVYVGKNNRFLNKLYKLTRVSQLCSLHVIYHF